MFISCHTRCANILQQASTLRRLICTDFSGTCLNGFTQVLDLTPLEEEALWTVVDYNTMSNQLSEDEMMSGQTLNGSTLSSWVDLFNPIDYAMLSNINSTSVSWPDQNTSQQAFRQQKNSFSSSDLSSSVGSPSYPLLDHIMKSSFANDGNLAIETRKDSLAELKVYILLSLKESLY